MARPQPARCGRPRPARPVHHEEGAILSERRGTIVPFDGLDHTKHADELVGADFGDLPFSVILVHSSPGVGPKLHRHPYAEVFIVEAGQATFRIGDETAVVEAGHVVVSPPGEAHGFTNSGAGQLRLIAIHGAPRFDTEWLDGDDPTWRSNPTS